MAASLNANVLLLLPEAVLAVAGILVLLADAFAGRALGARGAGVLGLAGTALALLSLWRVPTGQVGFGGAVQLDGYGQFFRLVLLVALLMVILASLEYVERRGIPAGEFYFLLLLATAGAMVMVLSVDLISFYVGLELLSICSYVLAGLLRDEAGVEASTKYFVNGALASAILLFGFSLLFGLTGATSFGELARGLFVAGSPLLAAAVLLVLAGLGFKMAAVPFHLWAPDTYQGAPTPVAAFLAAASEGAAVAAMLRLVFMGLEPAGEVWTRALALLAFLTMTVGNLAALHQTNVKRLLAYSSVAHVGYILTAVAAAGASGFLAANGVAAAMFYVLAYAFMNVGAFAVLAVLANQGEEETLEGVRGLARREPVLAFFMFLFLLSLVGIPPLAGFWAKLFVFRAAVEAQMTWLAVAVAVNSAISVGYYYAVVKAMYVTPAPEERAGRPVVAGWGIQVGLALAAAGVLYLGLRPEAFLNWAALAAALR